MGSNEGTQTLYNEERSDSSDERPAKSETLDRISALPESIILHILSLLPMHEVVKTSSLSKNWQHLWTSVPNLVFTNHKPVDRFPDFVRFVHKTLILYKHSKVHRFSIDFEYILQFASHIDLWIRFAMACNVEELFIDLVPNAQICMYNLPDHTYRCSSLTKLKLRYCNVVPKGVISWNSLKNLCLEVSDVSEDSIQKILSGSPLLKVLELDCCRGFKRLDINSTNLRKLVINGYWCSSSEYIPDLEILAPSLRSVAITGNLRGRTLRLINMLSLVDARLNFYCTGSGEAGVEDRNMFKELLQSLNHVKELTLGFNCLWWCGASTADSYDLEKYWTSTESIIFSCLRQHLTIVKFVGFNGWALERVLPFLELLLKNAHVLKKMVISMQNVGGGKHSCCASKELLKVARKLLNSPRSSQNAVVMFTE